MRGSRSSRYFDDDGNSMKNISVAKVCRANYRAGHFKFPGLISKERGFENKLTVLEGDEKQMFLNFVSRLLRWRPEDRGTAQELLSDPWLKE
jgi:hypothetical protein